MRYRQIVPLLQTSLTVAFTLALVPTIALCRPFIADLIGAGRGYRISIAILCLAAIVATPVAIKLSGSDASGYLAYLESFALGVSTLIAIVALRTAMLRKSSDGRGSAKGKPGDGYLGALGVVLAFLSLGLWVAARVNPVSLTPDATVIIVDENFWRVVADVVVPVSAVLVSAGVAIWLARRERHVALADRVDDRVRATEERGAERERSLAEREEERMRVAKEREEERMRVEADRVRVRVEESAESVLTVLAWFISADPTTSDWHAAGKFQALRAKIYTLQTLPDDDVQAFSVWLANEVTRGYKVADKCMDDMVGLTSDRSMQAALARAEHLEPFRHWVQFVMDAIVLWLRGDTSVEEIELASVSAASVRWLVPESPKTASSEK